MKPSYITVNFQQTAAQRFPAQADELNAAFTARLQALQERVKDKLLIGAAGGKRRSQSGKAAASGKPDPAGDRGV